MHVEISPRVDVRGRSRVSCLPVDRQAGIQSSAGCFLAGMCWNVLECGVSLLCRPFRHLPVTVLRHSVCSRDTLVLQRRKACIQAAHEPVKDMYPATYWLDNSQISKLEESPLPLPQRNHQFRWCRLTTTCNYTRCELFASRQAETCATNMRGKLGGAPFKEW